MLFKTRQQAILSVIRIKVDRDINIGRACRKATITLDEQHDNDNCFFFHSATVACFDILDQIFPLYCYHSGIMGPTQRNDRDVSSKCSPCVMQEKFREEKHYI